MRNYMENTYQVPSKSPLSDCFFYCRCFGNLLNGDSLVQKFQDQICDKLRCENGIMKVTLKAAGSHHIEGYNCYFDIPTQSLTTAICKWIFGSRFQKKISFLLSLIISFLTNIFILFDGTGTSLQWFIKIRHCFCYVDFSSSCMRHDCWRRIFIR